MRHTSLPALCVGTSMLLLAACSGQGGYGGFPGSSATSSTITSAPVPAVSGYGVVQTIDAVPRDSSGVDLGTVGGALAGGLLGNQIGSGSGQTAATIAGAAGGALVGRQVEKNMRSGQPAYRITLRMDDGTLQSVVQDSQPSVRIGDRVRVQNGVLSYG